jgi:DNA-directed RNA polymerase specialized sigma24 family protein
MRTSRPSVNGPSEKNTLSLHHRVADKNGKKLTLEDTLPDPKSKPANLLQAIILGNGAIIEDWAQKYCTPKQAAHVIRRFRDEKTQEEIAKEEGIRQQAVSKSILGACKRIREGLIRDGILEAG